jgi:hypothetical protein
MMVLDDKRYAAIRDKLLLAEIYLEDGARHSALRCLIEARALLEGNAPRRGTALWDER